MLDYLNCVEIFNEPLMDAQGRLIPAFSYVSTYKVKKLLTCVLFPSINLNSITFPS